MTFHKNPSFPRVFCLELTNLQFGAPIYVVSNTGEGIGRIQSSIFGNDTKSAVEEDIEDYYLYQVKLGKDLVLNFNDMSSITTRLLYKTIKL